MKICYFGNFNPNYSRNRVIIRGLKENGVEILFANTSLRGWRGLADLGKKYFSLKSRFDAVLVGYSDSRFMVPFIKLISDKKIIWDAFYSIYDSWVFDRKLVKPGSLKARYYWLSDWLSCKLADKILLDTNANIEYFKETFNVDVSKFTRVFVGTDDNIFKPELIIENNEKFIVHFHGYFIPASALSVKTSFPKSIDAKTYRIQSTSDVIPYTGFHTYMSSIMFRPPFSKEKSMIDLYEEQSYDKLKKNTCDYSHLMGGCCQYICCPGI